MCLQVNALIKFCMCFFVNVALWETQHWTVQPLVTAFVKRQTRNSTVTHPSLFLPSCLNSNHTELPNCCGQTRPMWVRMSICVGVQQRHFPWKPETGGILMIQLQIFSFILRHRKAIIDLTWRRFLQPIKGLGDQNVICCPMIFQRSQSIMMESYQNGKLDLWLYVNNLQCNRWQTLGGSVIHSHYCIYFIVMCDFGN